MGWYSEERFFVPLTLPIPPERMQSRAGICISSGVCDALAVMVQFSWADQQALPPAEMFIEKLKWYEFCFISLSGITSSDFVS